MIDNENKYEVVATKVKPEVKLRIAKICKGGSPLCPLNTDRGIGQTHEYRQRNATDESNNTKYFTFFNLKTYTF